MRSHDVASAAARLGSPNHLDTPWVTLRLGLDPQYESSPPPSRSFAGGRLLPPSLLTYAYTSNPRCARPLGLAARLPSSPHTVICPYFCAKYALNTVSCASKSLLAIRCRRRFHLPSGTSSCESVTCCMSEFSRCRRGVSIASACPSVLLRLRTL